MNKVNQVLKKDFIEKANECMARLMKTAISQKGIDFEECTTHACSDGTIEIQHNLEVILRYVPPKVEVGNGSHKYMFEVMDV